MINKKIYLFGSLASLALGLVVMCNNGNNSPYLIEKTQYIHSHKNAKHCKYFIEAKNKNYKIKRIDIQKARMEGYKMCKNCFSMVEFNHYRTMRLPYEDEFNDGRDYSDYMDSRIP